MAIDAAGLPADQFAHVRIFLLGHNGAAGGVAIVKLDEFKFTGAPVNEFFRQAREVHGADGCKGEELQEIVPVRHRIQAISIDRGEVKILRFFLRIGGVSGAGESACADRRHVAHLVAVFEAFEISFQHSGVSQHVVSKEYRLRALHVGVARQDHVLVFLRCRNQSVDHCDELFRQAADLALHVHMKVQGTLVVAASSGMETSPGITDGIGEPFLDIHMNVFEFDGEIKFPFVDFFFDCLKALGDSLPVFLGNDAVGCQHFRMGYRAGNIFAIHPAVIGNGCVEIERILFLRFREAAAPHHITHFSFFSFIRARMVSGRPKRLMKPSASAWLYTSSSPKVTNSSL